MQFKESKVAEVAAKAMNKYMMFGRNLDVHVMEDAHKEMFKHGNRDWKFVPKQLMHRNKINKEEKTDAQRKARVEGLLQKERERRDRLKELEIVYDFPGFSALVVKPKKAPAVKEVKKEEPKAKREQEPKKESTKQQISSKT